MHLEPGDCVMALREVRAMVAAHIAWARADMVLACACDVARPWRVPGAAA
eukprot:NODE_32087_length_383_cov_2.269531.p3 GENE.NODE_32087_length_383_cov_2.269531~~NODE_32087_length_383_cov_2.269531.p3  ORF type:complete len:50 (+),score=7.00 NODE_32087_length_383_cov_2.269531:116-265(+)